MLVAGLALLGLAVTQLKSLQFASNSFDYTMSLIQGQNAIERIWVRTCRLQSGSLVMSDQELRTWLGPKPNLLDRYTVVLPDNYSNEMQITVRWTDLRNDHAYNESHAQQLVNQISLNASYINLSSGCTPL